MNDGDTCQSKQSNSSLNHALNAIPQSDSSDSLLALAVALRSTASLPLTHQDNERQASGNRCTPSTTSILEKFPLTCNRPRSVYESKGIISTSSW